MDNDSKRHIWLGTALVVSVAVISGAAYFGMKAAYQSDTNALVVAEATQGGKGNETAAPETEQANFVINGPCQFGTCFWTRVDSQSVVADKPEGKLIRLVSSDGEHTFANGAPDNAKHPAGMEWGKPTTSYVLCAKRMPMFIDTDGEVTLVKSWGTNSASDSNAWMLWSGVCQVKGVKGLPAKEDMELYAVAIEGKKFPEPKAIFGSLPTYPTWLIGKWGWNTDDPQCVDSHTGFKADHTLDHYESGGRWMVVGSKLWTAWDGYVDSEGSVESNRLQRQGSDQLLMDGEPYFRCGSQSVGDADE